MKRIGVKGKNSMITAIDEISFREIIKGEVTEIKYEADISLNHIFCCCNCLIQKDLQKLAKLTEEGMKERCRELFGKNCVWYKLAIALHNSQCLSMDECSDIFELYPDSTLSMKYLSILPPTLMLFFWLSFVSNVHLLAYNVCHQFSAWNVDQGPIYTQLPIYVWALKDRNKIYVAKVITATPHQISAPNARILASGVTKKK